MYYFRHHYANPQLCLRNFEPEPCHTSCDAPCCSMSHHFIHLYPPACRQGVNQSDHCRHGALWRRLGALRWHVGRAWSLGAVLSKRCSVFRNLMRRTPWSEHIRPIFGTTWYILAQLVTFAAAFDLSHSSDSRLDPVGRIGIAMSATSSVGKSMLVCTSYIGRTRGN